MRWLTWLLLALILMLQFPLWLGKGSWLRVVELKRQLHEQRSANESLRRRNEQLAAEVRDLKTGYDALEERARYELGMIRQDELFIQVLEPVPVPETRP